MNYEQPENAVFHVLLVEDDETHAFLMQEALSRCSVANECTVARNGVEALERLRATSQNGRLHDLIFMDLSMPMMDGRETLVELKRDEALRGIPVVILTTSDNPKDVAECYARGAASYVTKPFDLHDLFAVTEQAMTFWCRLVQLPGRAKLAS